MIRPTAPLELREGCGLNAGLQSSAHTSDGTEGMKGRRLFCGQQVEAEADSSSQKSCVGVREVCLGAASTALLFRVVPTTFQCSRLRVVLLCQRSFDVEWIVAGVGKIPLTASGEMVKALFSRGSISNTAGDAG